MIKRDLEDNDKEKRIQMGAGNLPHPIFNAILGENLDYKINPIRTYRSYISGGIQISTDKNDNNIKADLNFPSPTYRNKKLDDEKYRGIIPLSLDDVIMEQRSMCNKEYRYIIDTGAETDDKHSGHKEDLKMYKSIRDPKFDFSEWKYKIPLFILKKSIDNIQDINNFQSARLYGIDLEFDTIIPEKLFKDYSYEEPYIYTPEFTGLFTGRNYRQQNLQKYDRSPVDKEGNEIKISGSGSTFDYADGNPSFYNLMNGLSGRHCKYEITAHYIKGEDKTFVHNDMIYDNLTMSNINLHKNMSHIDLMRYYCGGRIDDNGGIIDVIPSIHQNPQKSDFIPDESSDSTKTYQSIYPLPLNVTFEFEKNIDLNALSENVMYQASEYVCIGYLVIRTYKGVCHFMPPNLTHLQTLPYSKMRFYNIDWWANYLRTFSVKISIPRSYPSLVLLKNGNPVYYEVFSIPTVSQLSSTKIRFVDGDDHDNSTIMNTIKPNTLIKASYITHSNNKFSGYIYHDAFIRHIKDLGGFNGFLLPPERRCMDWKSTLVDFNNEKNNASYENINFSR